MEITIQSPKAFRGDRVFVHNYKKKVKVGDKLQDANAWEWGVVQNTDSGWYKDDDDNIRVRYSYKVLLDRKIPHKRYAGEFSYLILTVGDDGLQTQNGE